MKSLQKRLVCFVLILFISGCGTTIKTVITSDPPGADIYMGDTPDNMSHAGTTPITFKHHDNEPYWKEWYYQIKKDGYEESELISKPQGAIGADRYVHAKLKPSGERDTNAEQKTVGGAVESETKLEGKKLKSVVYLNIHSYIYTEPNFEGRELTFLDKGTKLTVLYKKENWIKVESEYFGTGWIQTNRVVADASEFEKAKEKKVAGTKEQIKPPKSESKLDDENLKCAEIRRLSGELMGLTSTFPPVPDNFHWDFGTKAYHPPIKSSLSNFSKVNGISLKILRLMDELHTAGPEKQIPDCSQAVKLKFCRKATVSFSGKGLIDREDARIKYKMTGRAPAILQIDFTVIASPIEIIGYGFLIMSETPFVTYPSTHVEFNGDITWFERVKVTQFVSTGGPVVTMAGSKMVIEPYFSVPYTATVDLPKVSFYTNKVPPKGPLVYLHDFQWSPIRLSEQDLQKAFEKGRLTLRRKTETESLSGTVTIDFAPPDPELQATGQSNPGGVGLWGDRTTHGGFLLATEKEVFSDKHPVAKEGDPVLCPIHGLSKVSRDESSRVYIGDKTVAVSGGKADCGAKILSESTLMEVQPVKQ